MRSLVSGARGERRTSLQGGFRERDECSFARGRIGAQSVAQPNRQLVRSWAEAGHLLAAAMCPKRTSAKVKRDGFIFPSFTLGLKSTHVSLPRKNRSVPEVSPRNHDGICSSVISAAGG